MPVDDTGAVRVRAGGGVGTTTFLTDDGRPVYVQFDLDADSSTPSIQSCYLARSRRTQARAGIPALQRFSSAPDRCRATARRS